MPTVSLHCDSQEIMSRAFSKIYNDKSRHIALRHEYIRQLLSDGIITVVYVRSSKNLADPLTKVSHPQPSSWRMKGARNNTRTLYLLFQALVVPSLITESKYHIQRYKIELPP